MALMTRLLRCSNGHQWQALAPAPGAGSGTAPACPVCGSLELTDVSPPTVPTGPAGAGPDTVTLHPPQGAPVLAGYEVLDVLGSGGMGIVYRARQLDRGRIVALKVMRKERLPHPEVIRRFRREAQAAARLSHPNVVMVYESDRDGDTHFLAMEYVPGITLQRLVEETGPLAPALACDFVRQTALGLQHAAEQALVHRDIKPANLMVVAPPGAALPPRPLLKILDMGVARLYQLRDLPEDSLTTLTRDGAVIGTPDYIAPEQLEDPHGADIRADLYSLGCTFYFLLTGGVPFPGGTLVQKLDRQRWETPPSVDQLRPQVPRPVAAVVRRLMAKHPDDRYPTPGDLAAALDQLARTGVLPRDHQPAPVREAACLTGHQGAVNAVAFLPDGKSLASGGADRFLHLWDAGAGRELRRLGESSHEVACLAVAPLTGHLLAGQGVTVRAWDPLTGREVLRLAGHTDAVRGIAAAGKFVLTGGDDRTVRLWDAASGRELQRMAGHRARISSVALSPDGRLALSAGHDQTLRLWEARSGRELRTFAVPRGQVLSVAFAPDGETAASSHFDMTVRLWDLATGRELRRFVGHKQMVAAVAVSPDGRRIASAGHDQTLRVWDPDSGAELWCCQGHTGAAAAVAFAPDGRRIVSGGHDQTVRLWLLPE
jgi:WD40 repeat protein/tRNA A-37 threonylcarbamoyl transferase component Bud32